MMPANAFSPTATTRVAHRAGARNQSTSPHGEYQYVGAQCVRSHIATLRQAGMSDRQIAKLSSVSPSTVQIIMDKRTGPRVRLLSSTAAKILAVALPPTSPTAVADGAFTAAAGTARRLRALIAIGYTPHLLSRELGLASRHIYALFGERDRVPMATAQAVTGLFDRLEMTPGPSQPARGLARKLGWAPPLAWDEDSIDDPAADPAPASGTPIGFAERYRELRDLGVHDEFVIARRLGMKVDSLQRQLARHREAIAS